MTGTLIPKLKALCEKITKEQIEVYKKNYPDTVFDLETIKRFCQAHYTIKRKYTYVDIGTSGRYLVDTRYNGNDRPGKPGTLDLRCNGDIFGCKAYGKIHHGHSYGDLNTIDDYYWGNFYATKIKKEAVK